MTTTVQGTLRHGDGGGVVHLEVRVDAAPGEVWAALTDPDRLAAWLGELAGDLREGSELTAVFRATGWEGRLLVEACEPGRRLLLGTRSEGEPDCILEVLLRPDRDGTHLVLEDRGLPVDQLWAYGGGDQVLVEDLVAHLAGQPPCADVQIRWGELAPGYRELASAF